MAFTIPNRSQTYNDTLATPYLSDYAIMAAAGDTFVMNGLTLAASATSGRLDMTGGRAFFTSTTLAFVAQTAIATTITSLADATNPKWVLVELDNAGVVNFNAGTAAPAPEPPAITPGRIVLGALYIPATATQVDALIGTNNGKAKLIDKRIVHKAPAYSLGVDQTRTILTAGTNWGTNGTTETSVLGAVIPVPSGSIAAGDVLIFDIGLRVLNNVTATTWHTRVFMGPNVIFDTTTASIPTNAAGRSVRIRGTWTGTGVLLANGGSEWNHLTSTALGGLDNVTGESASSQDNESGVMTTNFSLTSMDVDVKFSFGAASAGATLRCVTASVYKIPA